MRLLYSVLLSIVLFSSCYSEKKAAKQLSMIELKQPHLLENLCAVKFPILENTVTNTIYKEGSVDTQFNFIAVDCDTVPEVVTLIHDTFVKSRLVSVPCPAAMVRIDTFSKEKVIIKENTASKAVSDRVIAKLQSDIHKERAMSRGRELKLSQVQKKFRRLMIFLIGFLVLLAGVVIIRLKLKI